MASNRSDNSNTGNNKAKASGERARNEQSTRVRDDGRFDTDLDDDRTDQRMTAQNEANRQAHEAMPQGGGDVQGGEQIDHGSHARAGSGKARQTDGS